MDQTSSEFPFKLPRLYIDAPFSEGAEVILPEASVHYLKTVLRRKDGDEARVFNGQNGEYLARLKETGKKTASLILEKQLRPQAQHIREVHLIFTPLKKDALDFLIEKAVELGATHFHPVTTQQTAIRDIKLERLQKQIVEAAEQCERLDIPQISDLKDLTVLLRDWPQDRMIHAALEREKAPFIGQTEISGDAAFLIGPEGGFSQDEKNRLAALPFIRPVNLGQSILRAETAALFVLARIKDN